MAQWAGQGGIVRFKSLIATVILASANLALAANTPVLTALANTSGVTWYEDPSGPVSIFVALSATGASHAPITSKPTCFPNYIGSMTNELRYVQGPSAVRMDDGSVVVLVDTGTGTGEGTYALRYTDTSATWLPIQSTNDFDRRPRTLHESAYPTLVKYNKEWFFFDTETAWYDPQGNPTGCDYNKPPANCSSNRDRISYWVLPNPWSLPTEEHHFWLEPQFSACAEPFTKAHPYPAGPCWYSGSGFGDAVVINNNLYLYHKDQNGTDGFMGGGCSSGLWRTHVNSDMTYDNPPDCVLFDGPTPVFIGDVASWSIPFQTSGVRMLGQMYNGPTGLWSPWVGEWASRDGLHFSKIGEMNIPCDKPGCFIADPAYLRDESGALVDPPVFIGSTGIQANGFPINLDWILFYVAAEGAVLPATFGEDAISDCSAFDRHPPIHKRVNPIGPIQVVKHPRIDPLKLTAVCDAKNQPFITVTNTGPTDVFISWTMKADGTILDPTATDTWSGTDTLASHYSEGWVSPVFSLQLTISIPLPVKTIAITCSSVK